MTGKPADSIRVSRLSLLNNTLKKVFLFFLFRTFNLLIYCVIGVKAHLFYFHPSSEPLADGIKGRSEIRSLQW